MNTEPEDGAAGLAAMSLTDKLIRLPVRPTDSQQPAPNWPTCKHQVPGCDDLCPGRRVDGFSYCLAHLNSEQLDQVLSQLRPGAELDATGTPINAELLGQILQRVEDADGRPRLGTVSFIDARFIRTDRGGSTGFDFRRACFGGSICSFDGARFEGDVKFDGARFEGYTRFVGAVFDQGASFTSVQFRQGAVFSHVTFDLSSKFDYSEFRESARFVGAEFGGLAKFDRVRFGESAAFDGAMFKWYVSFKEARFAGDVAFDGAQFGSGASVMPTGVGFRGAKFENAVLLGPLAACELDLSEALFNRRVVIEAAAGDVRCRGTTWAGGVTLRLRYASVDLERATFNAEPSTFAAPSSLAGADRPFEIPPFTRRGETRPSDTQYLDETQVSRLLGLTPGEENMQWVPVLSSLVDVDVVDLVVIDTDMGKCRFAGAHHLDQLRLEGRCPFSYPPRNKHVTWLPSKWTRRQVLWEECIWRGWLPDESNAPQVSPERLATLYRALRKAFEDAKNEPGAADFYYGEMEMRRHSRTTPRVERAIVWLYWLISGYGLRALRSLAALVLLGVIVTAGLTGWGLTAADLVTAPPQYLAGTVTTAPHERVQIRARLSGISPPLPQPSQRWTRARTLTALEVALESFAFRSTDQPLTTEGAWITAAARVLGPLFLALSLLAIRNRVKR